MREVRLTHVGGPTVLIGVGGWRLLVDPTFDAPGRRYAFGWGTSSRKVTGPAVPAADVLPVDVWSHFRQGRAAAQAEFDRAPADVRGLVRWLPLGRAVEPAA